MASVDSQLIEEVIEHVQRDSLEDAREICADGTYFPNNIRTSCRSTEHTSVFSTNLILIRVIRDYSLRA